MERFVWKGHIFPSKKDEYIRKHDEIWPEMVAMMKEAGLRNYSIWLSGDELIGYYEFDVMEKKRRVYAQHQDVLVRWQQHMDGVMEMDKDAAGSPRAYRQVFLME